MRIHHQRRRRPAELAEQIPQPGFTPFQCVQLFWLNNQGVTQSAIAQKLDCNQSTISRAVKRGRETFSHWDLSWLKLMPIGHDRQCGHDRPIQVGEEVVCLRCFVSGYDETDAMRVTVRDLAAIERNEWLKSLPKDANGEPILPPQEPTKPYAEQKFGGRGKQRQKRLLAEAKEKASK